MAKAELERLGRERAGARIEQTPWLFNGMKEPIISVDPTEDDLNYMKENINDDVTDLHKEVFSDAYREHIRDRLEEEGLSTCDGCGQERKTRVFEFEDPTKPADHPDREVSYDWCFGCYQNILENDPAELGNLNLPPNKYQLTSDWDIGGWPPANRPE